MRPFLAGLAAAHTLAAVPASAQPRVTSVAVSDLVGLTPKEARSRLVADSAEWPLQPTFEIVGRDGVLTFYEAATLIQHPESAAIAFSRRTQGNAVFRWDPRLCRIARDGVEGSADRAAFLFHNGRFEAAYTAPAPYPMPPGPPRPPAGAGVKDQIAWSRALSQRPAAPSPFLAGFGALPLTDGVAFLQRWRREPIAAGERITTTCNLPPPAYVANPPAVPASRESLWRSSDLALLPLALIYAPIFPLANGARGAALERGLTQLSLLKVGEPLGDTPERYAQRNKGVRVFREGDADYAVLSLDLGGAPSRTTDAPRDAALVGVRRGRVEWISPPADFGVGPKASVLCLDKNNVAAAPRAGCHGYGNYSPS